MEIIEICGIFDIKGRVVGTAPYGNGHINDTHLITTAADGEIRRYILQKINKNVFKNVEALMSNLSLVTSWQKQRILTEGGNPDNEALCLVYTKSGESRALIDGEYYRMYVFIENCISLDKPRNTDDFAESAVAYGKFIKRLQGFDASSLFDVIPDFHNTPVRYKNLLSAVEEDFLGRSESALREIAWAADRQKYCGRITSLIQTGEIPVRVTHNDMKLNNVLLDKATGKAAAVIDLDTVMKGSTLYDFGDAIRSGCNTAAENERNLKLVEFDLDMYNAYAVTFSETADYLVPAERELLAFSGCLMTYECGIRFLADYLGGDTYFKISYSDENLVRARTQFKLVEEMERIFNLN